MAKRPINGVPHPKHRGVFIPAKDPASQRAQRVYGPGGGGGGGGGSEKKGCLSWLGCTVWVLFPPLATAATVPWWPL